MEGIPYGFDDPPMPPVCYTFAIVADIPDIPVESLVNIPVTDNSDGGVWDCSTTTTTVPTTITTANHVDVIAPVRIVTSDAYQNKRPRRAAAVVAIQRVQDVLKWERCKESSSMFMNASEQINAEFDRVSHGVHIHQKNPVTVTTSAATSTEVADVTGAPSVDSDDENNALNSDIEDHDAIDNDDDDVGSLASFVVDDAYVSDASMSPTGNVSHGGDSPSEVVDDSCSEDDSENDDSDFDDTMICDDDSDGDQNDSEDECDETDGIDIARLEPTQNDAGVARLETEGIDIARIEPTQNDAGVTRLETDGIDIARLEPTQNDAGVDLYLGRNWVGASDAPPLDSSVRPAGASYDTVVEDEIEKTTLRNWLGVIVGDSPQ